MTRQNVIVVTSLGAMLCLLGGCGDAHDGGTERGKHRFMLLLGDAKSANKAVRGKTLREVLAMLPSEPEEMRILDEPPGTLSGVWFSKVSEVGVADKSFGVFFDYRAIPASLRYAEDRQWPMDRLLDIPVSALWLPDIRQVRTGNP